MQETTSTREELTRVLGLPAPQTFKLPERLPDLPKTVRPAADLESAAMRQRLDVLTARRDVEATADAFGLTKATRFVNVLDASYANKSQTGVPRENGYEVSLELPLFDWGGARTRKAESLYMAAVDRTADIAVRAQSEVREAYAAYRSAYDVAKHYRDEVVPLRKKISEEMGLRYNGMLASVFELLADARAQAAGVNAAIAAQRDFWLAQTDLDMAVSGSGGMSVRAAPAAPLNTAADAEH